MAVHPIHEYSIYGMSCQSEIGVVFSIPFRFFLTLCITRDTFRRVQGDGEENRLKEALESS